MKEIIEPLFMNSQGMWRKWLAENFDKVDFVWLALNKKNSKIKCVIYKEALDEALCYGWIDGTVKRYNDDVYIQRFTPRKPKSCWSQVNKNKVAELIKSGKMAEAGIAKIEEAKGNGQWEKAYVTQKNIETPTDLIITLKKTKGALEAFNSFAPSHRNLYVMWVNNAKKEDTRKRRMDEVAKRSLQKIKPGML